MLQVHKFSNDADHLPQPVMWAQKRVGNRLDCETGVLLRTTLGPVFSKSESWDALRHALKARGFDLRFEAGRLVLIETLRGEKVCSCRFLGHPLASLTARLGKLRARAPRSATGYGSIAG